MGSGGSGSGLSAGKGGRSAGKAPEKVYGGSVATITESNVNKLIDMGANRWTKGDHDRLYLSGAGAKILGLEVDYYKSGNISGASRNGEGISHSAAGWLMTAYSRAYINLKTGEVSGLQGKSQYKDEFMEALGKYFRKK